MHFDAFGKFVSFLIAANRYNLKSDVQEGEEEGKNVIKKKQHGKDNKRQI